MRNDVAILIVTYNSEHQIAECLESVFAQRRDVQQQVIVLDNNSQDKTLDVVRRFPDVQILTPGKNLGFAAGVNEAARAASADYLLLLNPDTVILDGAIDKIVQFARANPQYGLYGGRTFRPNGDLEPSSCWGLPSLWSMAAFAFGLSTVGKRNRMLDPESLGKWERDTVREVGVITGCFLLVERTAWEKLEGFDERFFMYGEDTDLSMRARVLGYRPVICPEAHLVHEVGQSSATPVHKMMLLYRGKATFIRTHWRGLRKSLGLCLLSAGVLLRAIGSKVTAPFSEPGRWQVVWNRRNEWLPGYPVTRKTSPIAASPAPEFAQS